MYVYFLSLSQIYILLYNFKILILFFLFYKDTYRIKAATRDYKNFICVELIADGSTLLLFLVTRNNKILESMDRDSYEIMILKVKEKETMTIEIYFH